MGLVQRYPVHKCDLHPRRLPGEPSDGQADHPTVLQVLLSLSFQCRSATETDNEAEPPGPSLPGRAPIGPSLPNGQMGRTSVNVESLGLEDRLKDIFRF